jgi:hypothetical protein
MLAERFTAQLLSGPPATHPAAAATRLLAVQAQDLRGMRLAIRARTENVSAADVDRALSAERSLVVTWLNRGTLHLVGRGDYPWLHALTAPRWVTGNARRLSEEGLSAGAADRGVALIERSLADAGPLTRSQLRERLDGAGVRTRGQALIALLALVCLRGLAVRGPMAGQEQAYVLVRDWLQGVPDRIDRDAALAELARRYLAGHGPAGDRDLARWSGLPLRDARAGLGAIAVELVERDDGLLDLAGRSAAAEDWPRPRLLGAYEPVLLGWTSRVQLLAPHEAAVVSGGIFRPFALVRGRATGIWGMSGGAVELKPFGRLDPADAAALEVDAADVVRYLDAQPPPGGPRR